MSLSGGEVIDERVTVIQTAVVSTKEYLTDRLQKDVAKQPTDEGINFDHYFLALGDPVIGNSSARQPKRLSDLRFVTRQRDGTFFWQDWFHQGATSYSLLLTGVDPKKRVDIGRGKKASIEQLIRSPLQKIEFPKDHDVEWVALTAIRLKQQGIEVALKTDQGATVTLEELMRTNREEFDFKHHPEKEEEYEKEGNNWLFRSDSAEKGSCDSLHALHALLAYAILQKDSNGVQEYVDFTFQYLEKKLTVPQSETISTQEFLEDRIRNISHALTVLIELPADHPLTPEQQETLKNSLHQLAKDSTLAIGYDDFAIGSLAHAQDVFNRIPETWLNQ
ncbi:MAG: hypothetical protein Q7S68_01410 [Deltaproteobacteria bacterium]|nr:hypothetical protein [Deltaproteobacteria bacterium]